MIPGMWIAGYASDVDYSRSDEPAYVDWLMRRAEKRDGKLNAEEYKVWEDTYLENELGPNWWLRAHP